MVDLRTATEVFCECFAYGRSYTHPYLVTPHGPLLILHDGPRKGKQPYRASEVVAPAVPVDEVMAGIASFSPGRYFLCAIERSLGVDVKTRDAYKALGFRLMRTEPMMVADVSAAPQLEGIATVRRARTAGEADRVAAAAGGKQIQPIHLEQDRPEVRLYCAELDGEVVGWVKSVQLRPDVAWVSNMYTVAAHRRKGIAKCLLSAMLRDDASFGVRDSVLLASHTGAMLYPAVGYVQIGMLHLFAPPRG